jgi:carbamoyltransferase
VIGFRRYKENGKGYYFSPKLVDWLGPKRSGDIADDPYIHYAASMQKLFEDLSLRMIEHYLGDILRETGRLAFSGGGALQRQAQPEDHRPPGCPRTLRPAGFRRCRHRCRCRGLCVPCSGALQVEKMEHVYLGPRVQQRRRHRCLCSPSGATCMAMARATVPQHIARLLADGQPVAWLQGRMEFGPRALGGRSILGCPSAPGVADRINAQIKFRERWRPFCPSMLDRCRTTDAGQRASGTLHDLHLQGSAKAGRSAFPKWCMRTGQFARAGAAARVQPTLL